LKGVCLPFSLSVGGVVAWGGVGGHLKGDDR